MIWEPGDAPPLNNLVLVIKISHPFRFKKKREVGKLKVSWKVTFGSRICKINASQI